MSPAIPPPAPHVPAPRLPARARWLRRLEAASVYVPVLLMGLLALASYWLMRATPAPVEPPAPRPATHTPADVLYGFSVRTYRSDGALRSEVRGAQGRLYADDDSLEVDQPRIHHVADDGTTFDAQAQRAWVNGAHSRLVLSGEAVVVRRPPAGATAQAEPLEFRGNHLVLDTEARTLTSDEPVQLRRGPNHIEAQRMRYDDPSRVTEWSGRVRATLVPASGHKPS